MVRLLLERGAHIDARTKVSPTAQTLSSLDLCIYLLRGREHMFQRCFYCTRLKKTFTSYHL